MSERGRAGSQDLGGRGLRHSTWTWGVHPPQLAWVRPDEPRARCFTPRQLCGQTPEPGLGGARTCAALTFQPRACQLHSAPWGGQSGQPARQGATDRAAGSPAPVKGGGPGAGGAGESPVSSLTLTPSL